MSSLIASMAVGAAAALVFLLLVDAGIRSWRRVGIVWRLCHPWRSWGPRCGDKGPWRLADCGTCIIYRRHTNPDGPLWHADGTGFIWTEDRWAWRGPVVNLADVYREDPDRETAYDALFTEPEMHRLYPHEPTEDER